MYDYSGDMEYFQKQLEKKGITKDMLDITDYCGLTFNELQHLVDSVRVVKKSEVGHES